MSKTAVIYLRVSTTRQVNKAYNPDGYSLPAQKDDCEHKAASLDAEVLVTFIDRGETGRTADRPEFQRMLAFLAANQVDYLIVHKLDRWARNREDDILLHIRIRQSGAQLVSAKENIDETPSGRMLHGILATMNEFYSANLATEVLKGMGQKAREGGTPGRAPIGYLNVEERLEDGRRIRAVVIDPERGPLIALAFELYATGNYSLSRLIDELTRRGLRTRPDKRSAGKELVIAQMSRILHNPYYVGDVTFHDVVYAGRHQPLITRKVFEVVQDMLVAHNLAGDRERVHFHHLKGTVFCARCGSRLSLDKAKTNYMYYYCLGRARGNGCDLPYLPLQDVEDRVAEAYDSPLDAFQMSPENLEAARHDLQALLEDEAAKREHQANLQRGRLKALAGERTKLLRAHLADAVSLDLLKSEQARILREQHRAEHLLETLDADHSQVLATFDQIASLLVSLNQATYRALLPEDQRLLNQTLIEHALIDAEGPSHLQLTELGDAAQTIRRASKIPKPPRSRRPGADTTNPQLLAVAAGSRSEHLERMTGIEPAYSAWEADVLPLNYIRNARPSLHDGGSCPQQGSRLGWARAVE
jgi:site-specific DNA recombinase